MSMVKPKHKRGCRAVATVKEGKWRTLWVLPEYVSRKWGRNGRRHYIRYTCNDAACSAKLWIPESEHMAILLKSGLMPPT